MESCIWNLGYIQKIEQNIWSLKTSAYTSTSKAFSTLRKSTVNDVIERYKETLSTDRKQKKIQIG